MIVTALTGCVQKDEVVDQSPELLHEAVQNTPDQKDIEADREADLVEVEEPQGILEIDYQKTRPYEVGHIMIIMYHGLVDENPPSPYQRTREDFKKDLQYLYDHQYRPIPMRDLIDNNIKVEVGYTPIVLTFDDGLSSEFSLVEENGVLKPTPGCAVDIINQFAEEHPDFGKAAIFYINGNNNPFGGAGTLKDRLEYLTQNGYEIGNHTYSHPKLKNLTGEQIQEELGRVDQMIKEILPGYIVDSIAYPHGIRPKEELRHLIAQGEYNDSAYAYKVGLMVGHDPKVATAPNRIGFSPLELPRVRASEGEATDLWWFFEHYEKNPQYRYRSDGNPQRIAVPEQYKDNVDLESLGDLELYIYTLQE